MGVLYVTKSSMPSIEEYIEEIKPIWDTHILTNMGPVYKKFQHELVDYLGVDYLSLFTNGHMALEMAIQAFGITGEVITSPYTFVSTTNAIIRSGLTPVFCDIKPSDYTIDVNKIEELITDKTSAIVPVHVYGNVCDVEQIEKIAQKHNLKVIYDAAHAFGVRYKGKPIGLFGDASMFSLHATKVFNSVEGGAVTFHNPNLRKILHCSKNFGIAGEETVESIGSNAKMDEFRAAMGICNLRHIDECISARKKVYERYVDNLKDISGIKLNIYNPDLTPNYAYFPVYVDKNEFGKGRDAIYNELKSKDIYSRKYFYPATNNLDVIQRVYEHGNTPVSDDVSKNILTLPMYDSLSLDDVDRICDIILNV